MSPQKKERIFISYKREDKDRVLAIKDGIKKATGEDCWIDLDGIESDAQFADVIISAINRCEVFLFMYSASHTKIVNRKKDWTIREISFAEKKDKRIVFVNIDNSPLTDWFELNFGTTQQVDATDMEKLAHLHNDLCSWLKIDIRKKTETTQSITLEDVATQELLLNDQVRESLPETKVREIVKFVLTADGISSKYQERFVQDLKYGLATAQNNLGFALKDPLKKIKWLEKAVENGSGVAMITLGKIYANGEGVKKNVNKALDYFRAASSNGYHDEVVGDVKKLLEEIGDCDATKQVNIPTVFEKILTNKLDDRIQRLEASAMMGDVGAMIELANMYDLGIDVERNIDQAIYYYGQAVVKGGHTEYVDEINRLKQEKRKIEEDTNAIVNVLDSSNKRRQFTVNNIPLGMIQVEGGKFKMGAISRQRVDAFNRELPVREVTLSTYYIAETPITQELWQAVMGNNPSYFNSDMKNPVEQVSWEDCQIFIQKLNQLTGKNFRLPTEAEWEFAARGGINSLGYKYSGSNQIKEVAWQQVPNEEGKTYPVALKRPNELGVYDMSGNVWEWCNDWYGAYTNDELVNPQGAQTGDVRVCRGGCWHSHERYCCVFFRSFRAQHEKTNYIGLRLVMTE